MTVLPILRYPDARLRLPCQPVAVFDDALRRLAQDLVETMRAAPGIGITAGHVGVALRLVAIELEPAGGPCFYVNPVVEWASDERARHMEGSVSMPGVSDEVERPARVRVRFQDLDGQMQSEEAHGLAAVCLQHEIDQLDGVFWLQRLSRLKRDRLVRRFEKRGDPANLV
ncbi:peptide deformylase [Stella humosa]|uniref:Peptide deformylase-like n=1 Tax=Stella humosa TaxID=94 RepID=A0A3N1MEF4_9PROT|nr:peptide deformylase [Stella humosa]ROQ01077.1 peptide deformylase [Stella humosa]BBK31449.1 peptide deformylase-like protein [Stella humosa]